jgi:hypothetical protein
MAEENTRVDSFVSYRTFLLYTSNTSKLCGCYHNDYGYKSKSLDV